MDALLHTIRDRHHEALDGFFAQCGATLTALADQCAQALGDGGTLFFCGNGGSACDAMHIAGEFVGRFVDDRRALAAIALTADSGILTAIANDYGYEQVFSRQVEALGKKGDVLITLSTSGKSPSILAALKAAKAQGLATALFTGEKGAQQKENVDFLLAVPSLITAHIQEAHQTGLHALATLVESRILPGKA
ncbi:MAG: SIS domain-containing protein [Alphaproteobacteria bacterium]